jgi:hypothetical protein
VSGSHTFDFPISFEPESTGIQNSAALRLQSVSSDQLFGAGLAARLPAGDDGIVFAKPFSHVLGWPSVTQLPYVENDLVSAY